jgi:hypothetical protein
VDGPQGAGRGEGDLSRVGPEDDRDAAGEDFERTGFEDPASLQGKPGLPVGLGAAEAEEVPGAIEARGPAVAGAALLNVEGQRAGGMVGSPEFAGAVAEVPAQ